MALLMRWVACLAMFWAGFIGGASQAQTAAIPSVNLITAPMVSPTTAWSYYSQFPTTHTAGVAAWTSAPPEIAALAVSLGAGRSSVTTTQFAQNVLNYVRNNIAVEFRFGLGKGARGALIDQSGTPFDQAELMVKLLRQGGVTASYQVGTITLNASQFGAWTGLVTGLNQAAQTFTVNAQSACQFLADGGIPASVNGSSNCATVTGNLSSVILGHIWVQTNGNLYDPSFKQQTLKAGIDLDSAAGCGTAASPTCGASAVTAAMTGATTSTIAGNAAVANINQASVTSQLNTYAQNIEGYIRSNLPASKLDDVIGGSEISSAYNPIVGSALPYSASTQYTWTGDIPDCFRTTLTVQNIGISQLFYADEISGSRVFFTGITGSTNIGLYVESQLIAQATYPTTTTSASLVATHPYAASAPGGSAGSYASETVTITPSTTYYDGQAFAVPIFSGLIVHAWGDSSQSTQKFYSDLQIPLPGPTPIPTSTCMRFGSVNYNNTCSDDTGSAVMAQYLAESSIADHVVAAANGVAITKHHTLGIVDFAGTQFNLQSNSSVNSAASSASARSVAFQSASVLEEMLEGSVPQQLNDVATVYSTSSLFVWKNGQTPFIYVPSGNMASLLSSGSLTNYTEDGDTSRTTALSNAASQGYNFIIPQDGSGLCNVPSSCTTANSPDFAFQGNSLAYLIHENLKGGGATPSPDPTLDIIQSVKQSANSVTKKKYTSVDLSTGALRFTPPPDIKTGVGDFPMSLSLQRSYGSDSGVTESYSIYFDSSNIGLPSNQSTIRPNYRGPDRDTYGRFGGGWTHNFQITARMSNEGVKAMGQDAGIEASAFLAGVITLRDLFNGGPTFQQNLTSFFVTDWMDRQFLANSVTINSGTNSEGFLHLPSGAFNSPPGNSGRLIQTGVRSAPTYAINQDQYGFYPDPSGTYGYSGISLTYTKSDGSVIGFGFINSGIYTNFGKPVFEALYWTFPSGVTLNFNYSTMVQVNPFFNNNPWEDKPLLDSVSNNLGRSLTFNYAPQPSSSYSGAGYTAIISSISDENGRSAQYARSGCPAAAVPSGSGQFVGGTAYFACNTFTATTPDGASSIYSYAPGSDSPDPAIIEAPSYRLRRWYTPSNSSTPFQIVAYDGMYRVQTLTDILGHADQYFPSAIFPTELWKRTDSVDSVGNTATQIYDQFNSNIQSINELGYITTRVFDGARRDILTTNPEGDSVATTYDVRSNVLSSTHSPKPGSPLSATMTASLYEEALTVWPCVNYAICNKPTSETDARGNVTNYTWNSGTGQIAQILKPADSNGLRPETDLAYTAYSAGGASLSLLTQKTDKISTSQSLVTSFAYNASNKYVLQSATVDPSGLALKTSFTLDSIGNLTQMVGPRTDVLNQSNYTWDANRRLLMTIEANPGTGVRPATRYIYDLDGELIETDKGTTTSSTGSDFAAVETTLAVYDGAGNKIQDTVLNGTATPALAITQTSYDADDRELCTAVRMNPAVYGTLPSSACTLSTAGSNGPDRITQLSYDAAGHKLVETRAYGTSLQQAYATYQYTPNGQQSQVADANGNLTAMTYDGFDRLSQLTFPSPTTAGQVNANDYESYSYDANGNRVSVRKRSGDLIAYTYDALNREILKAVPGSGAANVYSSYDLLGHKLAATFGSVGGAGVNYTYDVAGRLTGEASNGLALGYAYDQAGNRTMIAWPDGLYVTYTYDPLNRMSAVNENGATQIASYSYDALGRRSGLSRSNGTSTSWTYDNADRLASLGQTLTPAANDLTLQFGYLPSSQIATRTASNDNYTWAGIAATTSYTPNGLNQYASVGGTSFTYDAKANLISDGARTFTYDVENRLLTASAPTPLTLTYDPPGRLQSSTASGATTQFLYAGDALVGEYNGSTPLRRYVPGPGEDEPVLWYEGPNFSNRNFLHTDNQGSIIAWTNATGTGGTFQYGPYGEPSGWTGSRYRYTGQIMIPEANLYHYKARVYDPGLGRFLQTDPIGYKDNLDLYAYVGDDSVNKSDPSGLQEFIEPSGMSDAELQGFNQGIERGGSIGLGVGIGITAGPLAVAMCAGGGCEAGIAAVGLRTGIGISVATATNAIVAAVSGGDIAASAAKGPVTGAATTLGGAALKVPGEVIGAVLGAKATGASNGEAAAAGIGAGVGGMAGGSFQAAAASGLGPIAQSVYRAVMKKLVSTPAKETTKTAVPPPPPPPGPNGQSPVSSDP